MIRFNPKPGVEYSLRSAKGTEFTGVLLEQGENPTLSPRLSGHDNFNVSCQLPICAINNPKYGWKVVEVDGRRLEED